MSARIIIIISGLFLSLSAFSQNTAISWADGAWAGIGYQLGLGTWTISLTVDQDSGSPFQISYPSLDCGGTWEIQKVDQGTIWLQEDLSYGQMFCVQNVIVALTRLDENHITFTCFNPDTKLLSSYSTLERLPNP